MSRDSKAAEDAEQQAGRLTTAAEIIEKWTNPPIIMGSTVVIVVLAHAFTVEQDVKDGIIALAFGGILPSLAYMVFFLKHRQTPTAHRYPRVIPQAQTILSLVAGLTVLYLIKAPVELLITFLCLAMAMTILTVITIWWPISVHNGITTSCLICLIILVSYWFLLAIPVQIAVSFSRLHLRAHTRAQVLAGIVAAGGPVLVVAHVLIGR